MSAGLVAALTVQLIRYAASTQAAGVVLLHGGWILLTLATWGHATGDAGAVGVVIKELLRAYVWLGGVDPGGHGDLDNLLAVWAKLSVVVYAIDALLRMLWGAQPTIRLSRLALLSAGVALMGYAVALWPQRSGPDGWAGLLGFIATCTVLAGLAAAWAVLARRAAERLIASSQRQWSAARG